MEAAFGDRQGELLITRAHSRYRLLWRWCLIGVACPAGSGCNAIRNGWLDPTVVGRFDATSTLEIRESLTLEDTPTGVPGATYPWPEDLRLITEDYPISAGDQLAVEIYELRERQIPYQTQLQVSGSGDVNLPVLGRVKAAGLTLREFEESLVATLREREVLLNPQVTINPLFLQKATYSIFGIGVSAADNAPLRAGTFPIRRPDLRLLEAINIVGGLNEFVTEVYVFRNYVPPERREGSAPDRILDQPDSDPSRDGVGDAEFGGAEEDFVAQEPEPVREEETGREEAFRALIEVVEAADQEAPDAESADREAGLEEFDVMEDQADSLEPDPALPYIWVNGEFVRNPAYLAPEPESPGFEPEPLRFESPSPTVNWARLAGESSYRIIGIPADALRNGDPEADIFVRPGDVIRVVSGEIGVYYVMGQVNRVGAFSFNAEPITLKAAIASAGGLSTLAWPDRCTVYRRVGQREQMIQVDLDRIFAGKDPDFYIRRSDIINVGTHPFAPFLVRIRGLTLPNPVSNVGYSFTYARNFADIDSYSVRQNPSNRPDRFPNLFP